MNDKLFIPQNVLDKWVESGKVVFNDNILTLAKEKKTYTLTPAVRFLSLQAGDDEAKLLGRLRTSQKLREMGAEHLSDSVILGDTAYLVQEGFIAVVLVDDKEIAAVEETAQSLNQASDDAVADSLDTSLSPASAEPPAFASEEVKVEISKSEEVKAEPTVVEVKPSDTNDAELLTKFLLNNLNF